MTTLRPAAVLCVAAAFLSAAALISAAEGDSLSVGQSIKHNESLVSAQGSFRLGFFTSRPNHTYLGIWYNNNRIPLRTVVWVANRLRPLPENSAGSLLLSRNGSLVLRDAAGTVYWSTDAQANLSNPVASLLEEGNLVVLGGGGVSYAWESFAEPTDTLLPGMKFGVNRRTGESSNLTSWKGTDDPSPGDYSLVLLDRGVPQLFVVNGTVPLWRGGPWTDERFTGIPDMKSNGVFSYAFTANSDELYLKFDKWSTSMVTRITLYPSGIAKHLTWDYGRGAWEVMWETVKVNDTCDRLNFCGANAVCEAKTSGPSCSCLEGFHTPQRRHGAARGGAPVCERNRPLTCPGGEDAFSMVSGAKLPDTSMATWSSRVGFDECRAACLRTCSCTAFSSGDGSGCITWLGDLVDIWVFPPYTPYTKGFPIVAGLNLYVRQPGSTGKNMKVIVIITVSTTAVLLLLLLVMAVRRKQILAILFFRDSYDQYSQVKDVELHAFRFSKISSATNSFSPQNKIGEGGFGTVYKGKLGGEDVAVKRLSKHSVQGLEEFKSETQLVAKLQHMNLVRLLGYCTESEEKILVYEYMPNQSLDKFIFDQEHNGKLLDWKRRFQIINGIAQGLLYLHHYSRLRVIHRDLKASNILLDDDWNPKISDFGLAKIFTAWNNSQANTNRIVGTHGYMSPEYVIKGVFSVKSDVFSFGVLLLEILSGKKNSHSYQFGHSLNLPGYAWSLWREGKELELVDPTLCNTGPHCEMSRYVHVALLCVQPSPGDRPTMFDVVSMLNNEIMGLREPNPPTFFIGRNGSSDGHLQALVCSNDVTISTLLGR